MKRRSWLFVPLFAAAIAFGPTLIGCSSMQAEISTPVGEVSSIEPGRKPIILVCPIDTVISNEDIAHLSRALGPLIRRDLFCVQNLSVVPTADVEVPVKAYFLNSNGLAKQAKHHGADIITTGILRGDSSRLSIEFRAYDVKNGGILFAVKMEDKTSRALRMQKELVDRFVEALGITLSDDERARLDSGYSGKIDAAIEYGKGLKELERNRFTEALIAFGNCVTLDDSLAQVYAARAKVFNQFNAPEKASKELETAVAVDRYYAEAWYQLNIRAAVYEKRDDLAMEYCYEALAIAPRYGKARLSLGARLYAMGNLEEAIDQTEMATELLPADAMPRYNLGIFYRDSGKPEVARKWFERALKVNPGFELARVELLNLRKNQGKK